MMMVLMAWARCLLAVLILDGHLGLQELRAVGDRAGDPGGHEAERPWEGHPLSQRRNSRLRFRWKVCTVGERRNTPP